MPLLLLISALASEVPACDSGPTDQDFRGTIALTEDAFRNLDSEAFDQGRDNLLGSVECATEVLGSRSVAGYFRVRALDAHLRRAVPDVKANAQAMAEIDPTPPSTALIPRGHPVRNAWEAAKSAGRSKTRVLDVPAGGRVIIDGGDTLVFPTDRPAVVQFVNSEGKVAWTRVVDGGNPPEYELAPPEAKKAYENAVIISAPRKPVELPVIAGVLAAGAIGVYAASLGTKQRFKRAEEAADIRAARSTTNALYFTSAGLAVGAVGIGAYAAARW